MLDWLVLGGALLSGLLGGVHCAAMCGGIATTVLGGAVDRNLSRTASWLRALQPNLGRVLGYAIAGAVAGGIGHGLVALVQRPMFSLALRVGVGAVLILIAIRLLDPSGRFNPLARPAQALWQRLRPLQGLLLPADTAWKRIGLGLLWGWLPCGLSATMLSAAWLQASAVNGALTMTAFGLGTWLVMVPLTWSGARIGQRLQRGGFRAAAGALLLAAGLLTIAAPWLMRAPALHDALSALGCKPLPM
ncbi:MAG: sulfite exporter TauE/SafE family protein [Lysobacter sp.]|nr:MAG: sulfite exporter TauE/SafE family protein [Lysobacter sp.]